MIELAGVCQRSWRVQMSRESCLSTSRVHNEKAKTHLSTKQYCTVV